MRTPGDGRGGTGGGPGGAPDRRAPRWVPVASFAARYLAEVPLQALEAEGIPVLVKGEEPGIWGPGFPGPTSQGIRLFVPEAALEDARLTLGELAGPEEG
ncbi:MAG: hypothetical protein RQ751_05930 [Longimicrobiales bacterium]|nr:hypothetical protein [Longimicrobiales bacterium]